MRENMMNATYMYRDKLKQASIFHANRKKSSPSANTGLGRFHLDVTDFKLPVIHNTFDKTS